MNIRIATYKYEFILSGHNNDQPIVKKMYQERLSNEEIEQISNAVIEHAIDNIDRQINYIKKREE